nr:MAG TPA: hypothetical protein [Caudoviricetes sp.]DAG22858.1 MAG TPA: hypothetical protein [Caudoviricetes sp.]
MHCYLNIHGAKIRIIFVKSVQIIKKSLYFNFYYTYDSKRGY